MKRAISLLFRGLTFLGFLIVLVPSATGTEEILPVLRLEEREGVVVFLDREGNIVGWIPDDGVSGEIEAVAATPPQLPGWPVRLGTVSSTPTVGDVTGDGRLEVAFASFISGLFYVLDEEGNVVPGWPLQGFQVGHTPSMADVDGDGTLEVFMPGSQGAVGLRHDGTVLPGWPQPGRSFPTLGVEDLDGDGIWEIAAMDDRGNAFLWDASGVLKPGWPFEFPNNTADSSKGPALGDVDGDGVREVAFPIAFDPSLFVLDIGGNVLPGFPTFLSSQGLKPGVSMADVDFDGTQELWLQQFVGTRILAGDGTDLPGWPVGLAGGAWAPAVGDLDGDGRLEMVFGTTGGNANVFAFNDDGTLLPGWPITIGAFSISSQPTLGDIDGDGEIEVVVGGFRVSFGFGGVIHAWNADGSRVTGFPFSLPDGQIVSASSSTLTDLDQDGDLDLLVGSIADFISSDGSVFAFDLDAPYNPTTMEWPTLGHDIRHTQRYEPPPKLLAVILAARTVECTSPSGADVTLDGSLSASRYSTPGTHDDIIGFEWIEGLGTSSETVLGNEEVLTLGFSLGAHPIALRVTDSTGRQDTQEILLSIVDTTPPSFEIALTYEMLWPPNHRMVEVDAQVSEVADLCGASSVPLASLESNEPDNAQGTGDGNTVNDIQLSDDLHFALRAERDGHGDGRIYTVVYQTEDASGNSATETFEVIVPHDLGGSTEPLMLSLSETISGTVLHWSEVGGTFSYDVVRGDLRAIKDLNGAYHLGSLDCIGAGISQPSTAGQDDAAQPVLGEGFFYLAAYDDGSWSGYGTESAAKERFVPPGQDGCH